MSEWLTNAARHRLQIEDGLAAAAEFEAENGPFTSEELAAADRWVEEVLRQQWALSTMPERSLLRIAATVSSGPGIMRS